MRKLIILFPILFLLTSCQEKHADSQLRILIRNGTDSLMTVKLYPKEGIMKAGRYLFSDINLVYKDTSFNPIARLGSELYITSDLSVEPHLLAAEIFDSLTVRLSSGKKVFRFSPEKAVNYPRNLFTDRSAWVYEHSRFERIKMWRDNYLESDDYIFVITLGD